MSEQEKVVGIKVMKGLVFFWNLLPAGMGSQVVKHLFFELEILHMFLVKACRDMGEGV